MIPYFSKTPGLSLKITLLYILYIQKTTDIIYSLSETLILQRERENESENKLSERGYGNSRDYEQHIRKKRGGERTYVIM